MSTTSLFAPLRIPAYRKLFTGQIFSEFGNWLDLIALTVLIVYHWNMGPGGMAALLVAQGIPMVFIGPMIAVWADRYSKRNLMLICDLLRFVLVVGFIFAPNIYVLLPLVFLRATLGSLFNPCRQGAVRMLVTEDQLPQAISLGDLVQRGTQILSPTLGGLILSLSNPDLVFGIEAGCLLISALFVSLLPALRTERPAAGEGAAPKASFWAEFKEGLRHIATTKLLLTAIVFMGITVTITSFYEGLLSVWTLELGMAESAFGLIVSAMGAGLVLGTLVAGKWTGWRDHPMRLMSAAAIVIGALTIVVGLGGTHAIVLPFIVWMLLFAIMGAAAAVINVPFGYLVQTETPEHLIGRAFGAVGAIISGTFLLSPPLGAAFSEWIGVGGVFAAVGVLLTVFASVVLLLSSRMRPVAKQETTSM